jgi:NTP pyrophosphatase (non-canonical NTP hydrolase)|tara:strand:+ start:1771 stop:2091 length:321 start_codon:yes stop_codon:yes gene_type:complete
VTTGPRTDATLTEWQAYIEQKIIERGFADESLQDKFILLVEEVGELAKALRPVTGVKSATDSDRLELKHEIADIFWLLSVVANKLDIDIDEALRSKEEKNNKRSWK